MNHNFNVEFATEYGVNEAILIENIYYWCSKNSANESHLKQGNVWTYNSVQAFNKLFPYLTQHKITKALKHLEEEELIKTGNFNENPYNRTKWYAVTEKGISFLQYESFHIQKNANGKMINGKCTNNQFDESYNSTINKPLNKPVINKQIKKPTVLSSLESMELSDSLKETLKDFIQMRKEIKAPMSCRALTLTINKLNSLSDSESIQIEILNQSIMNSWKGIFELKNNTQSATQNKHDFKETLTEEDYTKYDRF